MLMLACLVLLSVPAAHAQARLTGGLRTSAGGRLVESAVSSAIVLVTHSYCLKDNNTGALYGLQGAPEFGTGYGLGIKVKGGIILPDAVVRPWDFNSKFAKYKNDYTPVSYITQCAAPGQPEPVDSLTINLKRAIALVDSAAYSVPSPTFGDNALALYTGEEDMEGWVVWFTFEGDTTDLTTSKLRLFLFTQKVESPERGKGYAPVAPDTQNTIMGGMFVVPVVTAIGTLEFRLAGLLTRHENEWTLSCPFIGNTNASLGEEPNQPGSADEDVDDSQNDGGKDELTPIGTKDSKKKKKK